jgi:hypothetical protein
VRDCPGPSTNTADPIADPLGTGGLRVGAATVTTRATPRQIGVLAGHAMCSESAPGPARRGDDTPTTGGWMGIAGADGGAGSGAGAGDPPGAGAGAGDEAPTETVPVAVAVLPPLSPTLTVVANAPACSYVCPALTAKPPAGSTVIVGSVVLVPSPQAMVAVYRDGRAPGAASAKPATRPANGVPATAVRLAPLALSAASATEAEPTAVDCCPLASPITRLTGTVPASPNVCVALTAYVHPTRRFVLGGPIVAADVP